MATKTKSAPAPVKTENLARPKWRIIDEQRSIIQAGTTSREITINLRRDYDPSVKPFTKPLDEAALADEFQQSSENFARLAKLRAKLQETDAKLADLNRQKDEAMQDLAEDGAIDRLDYSIGEAKIVNEVRTGIHSAIEATKQKLLAEARGFMNTKTQALKEQASEASKIARAKLLDALNELDEMEVYSDRQAEFLYLNTANAGSVLVDRINAV